MNEYYVYFIYQEFENNPPKIIYVGKGKKRRLQNHLNYLITGSRPEKVNAYLFNKCQKTIKEGGKIFGDKIKQNLSEEEALELEASKIEEIGIDNLCNISPFGSINTPPKGSETYNHYIENMRNISKERWADDEFKTKMLKVRKQQGLKQRGENHPNFGKKMPEEHKELLKKINSERVISSETRDKMREKMTGRNITWKDKISEGNKRDWEKRKREGYTLSEEAREKISKANKNKKFKSLDENVVELILKHYKNFGTNRVREALLEDGYDVSNYLIIRTLKDAGVYVKFAKRPKNH